MSMKGKLAHVEITDTGRVRDHNEDSIGSIHEIGLWVLAAGMGGYQAGAVSSGLAVQPILDLVPEAFPREDRGENNTTDEIGSWSLMAGHTVWKASSINSIELSESLSQWMNSGGARRVLIGTTIAPAPGTPKKYSR